MANYANLKDIINNPTQHGLPAWNNDANQIDGVTMKGYLLSLIDSLTVGYQFMGVATPSTNPGTPDQKIFYLASQSGVYSNFSSKKVNDGEIAILRWTTAWFKDVLCKYGLTFTGDDSTIVYSAPIFNLIPGKTYKITFKNTTWPYVGSGNVILVQSVYNGAQTTILEIPRTPIKESYEITIPSNSDYVLIGGRAISGTAVSFDVSLIEESFFYKMSSFVGAANNLVNGSAIYGLIPGRKYRILVLQRTWDITGVSSGFTVFSPKAIKSDSTIINLGLDVVTTGFPLAEYYDFILPEDCIGFKIVGRAAVGVSVGFDILDLTDIENATITKQDILKWVYNDAVLTPGYVINAQEGISVRVNHGCIQQYLEIDRIGCLYGGAFNDIVCILYDENKNRLLDTGWLGRNIVTQSELRGFVSGAKYVRFSMDKGAVVTSEDWFLITMANILVPENESGETISYVNRQLAISDTQNEKLCQCPTVIYSDGYLYVGYYASKTNKRESPTDNTILCRLGKINICNRNDAQYVDVLKCGDIVGDFVQSNTYPPYDPQIIDSGTGLLYLMVACPDGSNERRYVCRTVLKSGLIPDNTLVPLTFTYTINGTTYNAEMKTSDLNVFIDRIMGRQSGTSRNGDYPILSNIEFYDGYFYSWLGGLQSSDGTGYMGCLIRSANGIDWELVTCPTQFSSITRCWEAAIAIRNGLVYVFWRFENAPRAYYNISTGVWSNLQTTLGNYSESRNFLFRKGNYTYGFANVQSTIPTPAGNVLRTEMVVLKFDANFNVVWQKTIQSDFGLVYPVILRISAGEYLVCASNRRWDYGASPLPGYPCSEISSILINGLLD